MIPNVQNTSQGNITQLNILLDMKSEDWWKLKKYQHRVTVSDRVNTTFFNDADFEIIVGNNTRKSVNFRLRNLYPDELCHFSVKIELKYLGEKTICKKLDTTLIANRYVMTQSSQHLNDTAFSDFTFIVKDQEFKVHKVIIANASEVMRKMLMNNSMESIQAKCEIYHIEPNIFDHLIRFMYTGQIPISLDVIAIDLFKAAHYYDIRSLMEICEQDMQFRLSTENAIEVLELATVYEMGNLKFEA